MAASDCSRVEHDRSGALVAPMKGHPSAKQQAFPPASARCGAHRHRSGVDSSPCPGWSSPATRPRTSSCAARASGPRETTLHTGPTPGPRGTGRHPSSVTSAPRRPGAAARAAGVGLIVSRAARLARKDALPSPRPAPRAGAQAPVAHGPPAHAPPARAASVRSRVPPCAPGRSGSPPRGEERVVVRARRRRGHAPHRVVVQRLPHLGRRRRGVRLQQQRRDPGRVRGGHGRAALRRRAGRAGVRGGHDAAARGEPVDAVAVVGVRTTSCRSSRWHSW